MRTWLVVHNLVAGIELSFLSRRVSFIYLLLLILVEGQVVGSRATIWSYTDQRCPKHDQNDPDGGK